MSRPRRVTARRRRRHRAESGPCCRRSAERSRSCRDRLDGRRWGTQRSRAILTSPLPRCRPHRGFGKHPDDFACKSAPAPPQRPCCERKRKSHPRAGTPPHRPNRAAGCPRGRGGCRAGCVASSFGRHPGWQRPLPPICQPKARLCRRIGSCATSDQPPRAPNDLLPEPRSGRAIWPRSRRHQGFHKVPQAWFRQASACHRGPATRSTAPHRQNLLWRNAKPRAHPGARHRPDTSRRPRQPRLGPFQDRQSHG